MRTGSFTKHPKDLPIKKEIINNQEHIGLLCLTLIGHEYCCHLYFIRLKGYKLYLG